ncbi:MAG TPA: type II toxin-antitoxin system RelE/ParE family toxin [Verrucomicrobiae bacterium]|jgi:plasmid stabilization system protein ParE|nr:type II toxin-antitoxin system RelE/ParE family toxin [Verrucomicrobiae bacterium]
MKIVILPSARDDLADGFQFYENQEAGLGNYFLESLFSDVDSLRLYAGIHRKAFGNHRALSKRFPYAIYYGLESQIIFVKAILDCRRDPEFHRQRLQ